MKKSKIAQIGNPILRIPTIDVPINEIKKEMDQKRIVIIKFTFIYIVP